MRNVPGERKRSISPGKNERCHRKEPWRKHARTILTAQNRFIRAVLAAFEEMQHATRHAWQALANMAVDAAIDQITKAAGWPRDPYERQRTVQVVATRIIEGWLQQVEDEIALGDDLTELLRRPHSMARGNRSCLPRS